MPNGRKPKLKTKTWTLNIPLVPTFILHLTELQVTEPQATGNIKVEKRVNISKYEVRTINGRTEFSALRSKLRFAVFQNCQCHSRCPQHWTWYRFAIRRGPMRQYLQHLLPPSSAMGIQLSMPNSHHRSVPSGHQCSVCTELHLLCLLCLYLLCPYLWTWLAPV